MTLRKPAAHLPTGWRRSGDESLSSNGASLSRLSRPQSAIEGRQLDTWIQHLQRMQNDHNPTMASSDQSTRTPNLDRETGRTWRPYRSPSFSGVSSSRGSQWGSLVGSQESLQSEFFVPVRRTGSLERVHITQTPKKEKSQVSCLALVKTGWLPVQKRVVMMEDARNQSQMSTHHCASQVKLKQPITPTFQKSQGSVILQREEERSPSRPWRTHAQGSPVIKQVPEKRGSAAHVKHGIWQALRRGWNTNRTSTAPRAEEAPGKSPQTSSTSCKVFIPLRRESSDSPVTPPDQLLRHNGLQPSHIQTSSAATTIVPRKKAGFSSITISSRKVTRSAGLASSDRPAYGQQAKTGQPLPDDPMDQTSSGVQRKPTIIKVVEQRTTLSSCPAVLDTVVHRRTAAIIKVTEHTESYCPARETSQHPNGIHKEHGRQIQGSHPETSEDGKNGDIAHTSTLRQLVSNPPAPSELSGQKPKRPVSCHGDLFLHRDKLSEESIPPPSAVRKWSLGLPQETTQHNPASWSPLGPTIGAGDPWKLRNDEWRRSSPCLTLIQTPEPHQSPEEVLALNAAAIIANIKLQRQLSKKETSHGNVVGESAASPRGNTDRGERTQTNPDDGRRDTSRHMLPVQLSPDHQRPRESISLQEALRRSRPHFVTRSQERVTKLERRMQERRERSSTAGPQTHAGLRQRRGQKAWTTNEGAAAASGKAKELRTNRITSSLLTDVRKRREEEKKKKEACLTNRQRVELFKKKLLDQILHRTSS